MPSSRGGLFLCKFINSNDKAFKVYAADFVTTTDGTGIVHIAPAFGEDDLNLGKKENLPFVQHVGMDGVIKAEAGEFAGMNVKPIGDRTATDVEIIKYLAKNGTLFANRGKLPQHSVFACHKGLRDLGSFLL